MMHHGLPQRPARTAVQGSEDVDAVLRHLVRQFGVKNPGASGKQIHQANELLANGAGLHLGGPADDEWHAVTALEDVGFPSAEMITRVVAFGEENEGEKKEVTGEAKPEIKKISEDEFELADAAIAAAQAGRPLREARRMPLQTRKAVGGVELDPNDPSTWGKVSRNAACPCGSGQKYKRCHGKHD